MSKNLTLDKAQKVIDRVLLERAEVIENDSNLKEINSSLPALIQSELALICLQIDLEIQKEYSE